MRKSLQKSNMVPDWAESEKVPRHYREHLHDFSIWFSVLPAAAETSGVRHNYSAAGCLETSGVRYKYSAAGCPETSPSVINTVLPAAAETSGVRHKYTAAGCRGDVRRPS